MNTLSLIRSGFEEIGEWFGGFLLFFFAAMGFFFVATFLLTLLFTAFGLLIVVLIHIARLLL